MKVLTRAERLILAPESDEDRQLLADWKLERADHVLRVEGDTGKGLCLKDLGPRADACREPVVIWSRSPDPSVALISNFAETPFELDGRIYRSVEGFWQGLKFEDPADRARVASLAGLAAKRAGEQRGYGATVRYEGQTLVVGTWAHWQLMHAACRAKFSQHEAARRALLATGGRPLEHWVRRDSRTIPAVIMADIWRQVRDWLHGSQLDHE